MVISFDIETIGTGNAMIIADLAAAILPPKTMSKPETIARWEAEEKPALVDDAVKKTAFDGSVGRIVCIGWAVDDSNPVSAQDAPEAEIIAVFFAAVRNAIQIHYRGGKTEHAPVFVGHNVSGFDLRFLWQRAVVHAIKPPSGIPFHAKPWDKTIGDTMVMWHPERDRRISLDKLCRTLGIVSPKSDLDGSKVWEYVKAGRIEEVAKYCRGDVAAVRECYRRMMFSGPLT